MKTSVISLLALVAICLSGCLYSPDYVYTYWKYSPENNTYTPIRTEYPISAEEQKDLGIVETLPEGAKITEPE